MIEQELREWIRTVKTRHPRGQPVVDVIVPVYGNLDKTVQCLRSVLESSNETPFELIVIDDATPSSTPGLAWLDQLAEAELIQLLRNERNLGFPGTCNRGLGLHPDRDVLLLNSDTEVFGDWLDRLIRAGTSTPRVATVTPLTNDGELASYPLTLSPNASPSDIAPSELDALAAQVNGGCTVEVPTGVGFCMLLRRPFLEQVGFFDAEAFGRGYGEENDLCRRAADQGWVNLLTTDTYVLHHGGGSFGEEKKARIEAALVVMEERHPGYGQTVATYISDDLVAPFRKSLDVARISRAGAGPRFLFVTHDWGGGTERHVQDMKALLERQGVLVFVCRPDDSADGHITVEGPLSGPTPNLVDIDTRDTPMNFAGMLADLMIHHVHIHNVAGYHASFVDFLTSALSESAVTYDVTIHDYQWFCPQNHLVGITGFYCGEPSMASCARCVEFLGSPFGKVSLWQWRHQHAEFLRGARRVFAPSADAAERLERQVPGVTPLVRPHPEAPGGNIGGDRTGAQTRGVSEIRVGLLGAVAQSKGSGLLLSVAQLARSEPRIKFVVLGTTDVDDVLRGYSNVDVSGTYDDAELESLITEARLDVIWFPAVWPETYSYTLSAALRTDLPIVAFDFGAIAERLRAHQRGRLLPFEWMLEPDVVLEALHEEAGLTTAQPTTSRFHGYSYRSLLRDYYEWPGDNEAS